LAKQVTGNEDCDDPALISAQRQICKEDATFNQTVAGGVAVGAVSGAALGALACALAGKNPLACAAIGAGAGAVAGGVGGYAVAKQQEASRQNVRAIDSVTEDIRKQNEDLQSQVVAARQVVANGQQKLSSVRAGVRAGTLTAEQASAERARIGRDSQRLGDIVQHLQEQEKQYVQAGQQVGGNSADYSSQLAEMRHNILILQQQKDALDRAMAAG
jgi:hypothetical protein